MHASLLIELHDSLLVCRTYSIPLQKHGVLKSMPTSYSACSCALLTVIAKQGRIGNCSLLNWKGSSLSEGVLSLLHSSCTDVICRYVSVYPLPARPELLYLSPMEALRLSRQDNRSFSLPPPLNSGNKQNSKGCAFAKYTSLRNTAYAFCKRLRKHGVFSAQRKFLWSSSQAGRIAFPLPHHDTPHEAPRKCAAFHVDCT